jgi:hypothetical protein
MAEARLHFIKQCIERREFKEQEVEKIPSKTRGIYVLLHQKEPDVYDVMYIGMTAAGVHGRLQSHLKSGTKTKFCSHFSMFEVHDNVPEEEIEELEGILRHIFRKDSHANQLAHQRGYGPLREVRRRDWGQWVS